MFKSVASNKKVEENRSPLKSKFTYEMFPEHFVSVNFSAIFIQNMLSTLFKTGRISYSNVSGHFYFSMLTLDFCVGELLDHLFFEILEI